LLLHEKLILQYFSELFLYIRDMPTAYKRRTEIKESYSMLRIALDILVRLAGIEPTTPWFVAKYSIQLSYSREKQNYSTAIL
jgi:hypothetical protein